MSIKEQLLSHFHHLQQKSRQLALALQKYQQEIDYVCIKIGMPDWQHFLAAVRTGKIVLVARQKVEQGESAAMALLNGLFDSASTARSTGRPIICECQSPVCSQGSVRHPKGGDTSRSESAQEHPQQIPYKHCKVEPQQPQGVQQESIQQILRYIEQYQQQKLLFRPMQGFDTFRKPEKEEILSQTAPHAQSTQKSRQFSSGRQVTSAFDQTAKTEHCFKPFLRHKQNWPIDIHQWKPSPSPNQYTLAVENTKLRKQLRQLQSRLI